MRIYKKGEHYPINALIRLLAKNQYGRFEWSLYSSVKESSYLFDSNMNTWSEAQRFFVYWCSFYDSIYQSIDRPPEKVIQDDDILELWLDKQKEKLEVSTQKNWSEAASNTDIKTAWQHPEVITFGDEEYDE